MSESKKTASSKKATGSKKSSKKQKEAASTPQSLKIAPPEPVSISPPLPKTSLSLTVRAGATPQAQTVVYIHGIGNKPPASVLKCQWDSALFGIPLGERSRMAYWVSQNYYPVPTDDTCAAGDTVRIEDDEASSQAIMALAAGKPTNEQDVTNQEIDALTDDVARRHWLRQLSEKMIASGQVDEKSLKSADVSIKVLPVPPFLRRLITRRLTRAFLRDANDFFFHPDRRQRMEQSLLDRLGAGGGPFIVIAHSQGAMIAYNVLRQLSKAQCDVKLLVTIGSPLGLEEVKDIFKQWVGSNKLPVPDCVSRWVNVAERLDPVAADNDISNDFTPKNWIENHSGLLLNPDAPKHPHSGTGYLRTRWVRNSVRETVGNAFAQAVGQSVIAKDLVEEMEDSGPRMRHNTLIQLSTQITNGRQPLVSLGSLREQLTRAIQDMVKASGDSLDAAGIDPLTRYVAARLTRAEIEQLRTRFKDLNIERVWRNASKRALICDSANTVQARTAHIGYSAVGKNITWAVLDTGIRADHPHFQTYHNVLRQWDCTQSGVPRELEPASQEFNALDRQGHGTHVAGVIAGYRQFQLQKNAPPVIYAGMAPQATLFGFKVLDDGGRGQDSWIIKAMDTIAEINEKAGQLIVQGVNLSLGGAFDPSVYGCGHTPLCQELRRLWRQGVVVCLAAGNEGYTLLQTMDGNVPANMDLSIGDPANLEEAIAVGSVHKLSPHSYGVSYFSSRGPTADGRIKPDLVAPGERILSASHAYPREKKENLLSTDDLYVEMSGTSMAAPHVSGILAAFLSVRREFIGYPDLLKALLLENCTDLKRDRYIQGHGLPNLIKMLVNS